MTVTSSSRSMNRAPPSTTIIVPSSRKPTPWPASLPSWMTRTRSSSPGRKAGFTALASELMLRTRMPCSSATRLRLKSLVRIAALARLASATSLASTSSIVGEVVVDDLDRRRRVLLHAGQDLQAAPAAVARAACRSCRRCAGAPRGRSAGRRACRTGSPDSTMSAMRPSMIALVSTTMCGVARPATAGFAGSAPAAARRAPRRPRGGPGAWRRSGPPCPGRGRARRRAAGSWPSGCRQVRQRQAEQEAHQEADEQAGDGGHELAGRELLDAAQRASVAGHDREVRQDERSRRPARRGPRRPGRSPRTATLENASNELAVARRAR